MSTPEALVAFLGLDREQQMIASLVAIIVASLFVSMGAWILLWKERRTARASVREGKPTPDRRP